MLSPHPLGRIHLDGVSVPKSNVLGEVDHGFRVAMQTLDLFRPSVGAFALGMAEAALRIATGHAMTRTAFGTPISDFQGVSHQLADVRLDIEAAELLVYSAAAAHDYGDAETLTGKAAMAKLHATETAQRAVDTAIQVLGARGLEAGTTLAHLYTRGAGAPHLRRHIRDPAQHHRPGAVQRADLNVYPRYVGPNMAVLRHRRRDAVRIFFLYRPGATYGARNLR